MQICQAMFKCTGCGT